MRENQSKYDSPFDKTGKIVGVFTSLAIHLLLLGVAIGSGLTYVYPPPPEQGILIDFSEPVIEEKPIVTTGSKEPRAKNANPENDIKLVQKSEAPIAAEQSTHGEETTIGPEGDVEVPEPPRKKEIDRRALFSSNRNKPDTLAPQAADKPSDNLSAGHIEGNTSQGNANGEPTARLQGRSVKGFLPHPSYDVEKSGTVVVEIIVDNYGNVINATAGAVGTTVTDKNLWKAAEEAARQAKFNTSSTAPAAQKGTITYVFRLK